jgi:hypothetical protein
MAVTSNLTDSIDGSLFKRASSDMVFSGIFLFQRPRYHWHASCGLNRFTGDHNVVYSEQKVNPDKPATGSAYA